MGGTGKPRQEGGRKQCTVSGLQEAAGFDKGRPFL